MLEQNNKFDILKNIKKPDTNSPRIFACLLKHLPVTSEHEMSYANKKGKSNFKPKCKIYLHQNRTNVAFSVQTTSQRVINPIIA